LVNGGQGLSKLKDGRYVFVWNALPNELVRVRLVKNKQSYAEGVAQEIIEQSPLRVVAKDAEYLATSPWQIINNDGEKEAKISIVKELFRGQKLDSLAENIQYINSPRQWHYRNKMEYSFWGDSNGLHLAVHCRGSRRKQIVSGSSLAMLSVDQAARDLLRSLETTNKVRAGELKSIILRTSQSGKVGASLFVNNKQFDRIMLPSSLSGLKIYFSDPKISSSVPTKLLQALGNTTLEDDLLGMNFSYDADAFFQVNVPTYIKTLEIMRDFSIQDSLVDMYCGVGSIGLSLAKDLPLELVEVNSTSANFAKLNARNANKKATIIVASTEKSIDRINKKGTVIFDPPRAGLHPKVIQAILAKKPQQILYLSCDPATLARDLALLIPVYRVSTLKVFNFFPKTPHIETLAVLELKV